MTKTKQRLFIVYPMKISLDSKENFKFSKLKKEVALNPPVPTILRCRRYLHEKTTGKICNVAFYKCLFQCTVQMCLHTSSFWFQRFYILRWVSQTYQICMKTNTLYFISLLNGGPLHVCTHNLFIRRCSCFVHDAPGSYILE